MEAQLEAQMEAQIIGLPGPSHYYGGLAKGNQASALNCGNISSPKLAALQCLDYMELLYHDNIPTLWLPPHPRPIQDCYSSSFMWVANAGTFISSKTSSSQNSFFRAANLMSHTHRSIESDITHYLFRQLLKETAIHVLSPDHFSDEGAANQMTLLGERNAEILVYNECGQGRQSIEASLNLAHIAKITQPIFIQQNPEVVRMGVFHNDVIAMSCGGFIVFHEDAFVDNHSLVAILDELNMRYHIIKREKLSVQDSISSYFFNSNWYEQQGTRRLILAAESHQPSILDILSELIELGFIHQFEFIHLKQSMQNGGGPACLRLRIPLSVQDWSALHDAYKINTPLLGQLRRWVGNFPEYLDHEDLKNHQDEFIKLWKEMPNFNQIWQGYLSNQFL